MRRLFSILAAIVLSLGLSFGVSGQTQAAAKSPVGVWLTKGGKSRVEVTKCGVNLCGAIVWLKEPNGKDGKPKLDKNNPNSTKHKRPLVGLKILTGFTQDEDEPNIWRGGRIYNPSDGKTYKCKITAATDGTLKVRGYVGISLFGKTQTWTPAK